MTFNATGSPVPLKSRLCILTIIFGLALGLIFISFAKYEKIMQVTIDESNSENQPLFGQAIARLEKNLKRPTKLSTHHELTNPPALFSINYYDHHNYRSGKFVENSNSTTLANDSSLQSIVKRRFRWIIRENFLSNFYLIPDDQRSVYSSPETMLVFLHYFKSAGTTAIECMYKIAKNAKKSDQGITIEITRPYIYNLPVGFTENYLLKKNHQKNIFFSGYSFGLCDILKNKTCAYFTIVRNPWDRLISSYFYCKHSKIDPLCHVMDASNVSIKKWALHQGSFFFRQLIYYPDFCSVHKEHMPHPCWYIQKVQLEKILTKSDLELILSYVLSQLEQWFAIIGLTEDYSASTELLQDTFGLPFHSLCASDIRNSGKRWAKEKERKKLRLELINDPEVNEVMSYDVRIYETAQSIYRRQREAYLLENAEFAVETK